jgi:hypothetical protein
MRLSHLLSRFVGLFLGYIRTLYQPQHFHIILTGMEDHQRGSLKIQKKKANRGFIIVSGCRDTEENHEKSK